MRPRSHLTSRQSKRFAERKKTRLALIAALCLIILGTGGFSLARLIDLDWFSIRTIYVDGADADIAPAIQADALQALQGTYFGFLSRSSTFLYPSHDIRQAALSASPRIASISVHRAGLQALAVSVTEKTPAALVCASLPDFADSTLSLGQDDDCFFADDTGYIYSAAPSFSGDVYNRYYVPGLSDEASSSSVVGASATSTPEFQALQGVFAELRASSIQASAILMKDAGEYELYVRNPNPDASTSTDSDMAVVYFNDARPFEDQMLNLISFWQKMTSLAESKRQPLSFEYIDVRYGSNVFYR